MQIQIDEKLLVREPQGDRVHAMIEPDPPAEPEPRRCPDCGMEIPGEWHFCPPEAKQGKAQEECDESWQRGYRLIGDPFDSLGDELP